MWDIVSTVALAAVAGGAMGGPLETPFPSSFQLRDLEPSFGGDGTLGTMLAGSTSDPARIVSAGDIDDDGFPDIAVDYAGPGNRGRVHVLYGPFGGAAQISVDAIDVADGFTISGPSNGAYASAVAAIGDINGDGVGEFSLSGFGIAEAYVLFGRGAGSAGFPSSFDLDSIDGTNGIVLRRPGTATFRLSLGESGDVNGDGIVDLVGGVRDNDSAPLRGYVVFGDPSLGSSSSGVIDPSTVGAGAGVSIVAPEGFSGLVRSADSDFDGDGINDIITEFTSADARLHSVIFGRDAAAGETFPAELDVTELSGSDGFTFVFGPQFTRLTGADSGGDVNGDGVEDLVVWLRGSSANSTWMYVVYGREDRAFASEIEPSDLNGSNGFAARNAGEYPKVIGDVNADGFADIGMGRFIGNKGNSEIGVLYGQPFFDDEFTIAFNGEMGFRLTGLFESDQVVGLGDLNGDGFDDFGVSDASEFFSPLLGYIVFGRGEIAGPCSAADLGEPFGALDIADVVEFLRAFGAGEPGADLAAPMGAYDIADVVEFLRLFGEGCP